MVVLHFVSAAAELGISRPAEPRANLALAVVFFERDRAIPTEFDRLLGGLAQLIVWPLYQNHGSVSFIDP